MDLMSINKGIGRSIIKIWRRLLNPSPSYKVKIRMVVVKIRYNLY